MKKSILFLVILFFLPFVGSAQQWQGQFTIDSRAGYSTNTLLNPFSGEWNRSSGSGYGLVAPMGQLSWTGKYYSADMSGGGVFEPYFDGRETLRGGFALMNFRRRLGSSWSVGAETGGSYFSRTLDRGMAWVQPTISWSPTLFSQVRLKAGSTFRGYSQADFIDRFDLYGLEYEVWPTFTWKISSGVYGNMDNPTGNLSFLINTEHHITESLRFSARLTADRYIYELIQEGGGNGPGSPFAGTGDGEGSVFNETDRLLRAGITGRLRLSQSFSVSLNLDHLSLHSSAAEGTPMDYHFSTGVQYTFTPRLNSRGTAQAQWDQREKQTVSLKINYSGDGQLYLIGDFNDWENPGIALSRQSSKSYVTQLELPTGSYEYKILLIEGSEKRWIEFSEDTYTIPDGFGGTNGLVFIQ
ncbi:MAG: glycogen-binding domain-containing protein [Balneolales bacterium]